MKIIEKDILTVESGIICQQVNCQCKMNSGLAKSIRDRWPIVYESFDRFSRKANYWPLNLLGEIDLIQVGIDFGKELYVCNIFGQFNFGYDKQRYTDYCALNIGFQKLSRRIQVSDETVYFPFNFGCDRGGADWGIVSKMIDYYFPNAIICKLPEIKSNKQLAQEIPMWGADGD